MQQNIGGVHLQIYMYSPAIETKSRKMGRFTNRTPHTHTHKHTHTHTHVEVELLTGSVVFEIPNRPLVL